MDLSEIITAQVYKLYDSLGKTGKPKLGEEWTNLAAFVFVVGSEQGKTKEEVTMTGADRVRVVSLATGTKCVGAESLCTEGYVVSDSHAEVLARRALLLSLYDEIETAQTTDGGSYLFSHRSPSTGKWQIKKHVALYLFTSHVPCGDASIIPFEAGISSCASGDESSSIACKKIKLDVHRTGAKPVSTERGIDPKGDGLNYHCRGLVRIKPGRGDPTKSLSCSDKIARWIDCGVEGALLSTLIDGPLRINGVIVGSSAQYNEQIMVEALVTRSKTEQKPVFFISRAPFKHSAEVTRASRPCAQSLIWSEVKSKKLEVAVEGKKLGATKKALKRPHQCLRITKRNLLCRYFNITTERYKEGITYREVKNNALPYKSASDKFKAAMGAWADDKSHWEMFSVAIK